VASYSGANLWTQQSQVKGPTFAQTAKTRHPDGSAVERRGHPPNRSHRKMLTPISCALSPQAEERPKRFSVRMEFWRETTVDDD
jgi:hypothetical protein